MFALLRCMEECGLCSIRATAATPASVAPAQDASVLVVPSSGHAPQAQCIRHRARRPSEAGVAPPLLHSRSIPAQPSMEVLAHEARHRTQPFEGMAQTRSAAPEEGSSGSESSPPDPTIRGGAVPCGVGPATAPLCSRHASDGAGSSVLDATPVRWTSSQDAASRKGTVRFHFNHERVRVLLWEVVADLRICRDLVFTRRCDCWYL